MSALEPTPFIWFDGKLVPWNEAKVHVLSHALHYGTSYFEGIRAYRCPAGGSAVFRLKDHMRRFLNSGKILGLPCAYDLPALEKAVIDTLVANKLEAGYIRPLAFAGYGGMGVLPTATPFRSSSPCGPGGLTWGRKAWIRACGSKPARSTASIPTP